VKELEWGIVDIDRVDLVCCPRLKPRAVFDPGSSKRLLEVFVEGLFARLTEQLLPCPLLKDLPAFSSAAVDAHHLMLGVVEIPIEELRHDVRVPQGSSVVAKPAEGHDQTPRELGFLAVQNAPGLSVGAAVVVRRAGKCRRNGSC